MSKYIDLISKDSNEVAKEELAFRAEEAKHDVTGSILETKKKLAGLKNQLAQTQRAVPYNLQEEVNISFSIESMTKALAISEEILKERF